MTTSDMIRALCEKQNISFAELCSPKFDYSEPWL